MEIAEHPRRFGYQPLGPCASGEKAVASVLALHPDMVLMDIALKGPMDGIQSAEAIRSTYPCPVIYVTAHTDQATLDRAKVTEPFGYVLKPISQRDLHIAIQMGLYRHGLERKLRESEERYRTAIESSNDGVVIARDGRAIYVNRRFLDLFGYDEPDEVLRTSAGDARHVHPDDREKIVEMIKNTQAGEAPPARYEFRGVHRDGRVLYVEVSATMINYLGGPAFLSYLRDITERKQAEEALRHSQHLLEITFASLQAAVFILDAKNSTILQCNPAASLMFGYSTEELQRSVVDILHVDRKRLADFRESMYTAIREKGSLQDFRFAMKRKDGTIFPTEHSVTPLEDRQGNRIGWVSVVRDITDREQAEEKIRSSLSEKEEANAALKVLLRHRDEDKNALETAIVANVKDLIFRWIQKLRSANLTDDQATHLDIIESNLNEVISPFLQKMRSLYLHFTPTEVQVANMIKSGKTSKEIAAILHISKGTVDGHRNNIRNKLGLRNNDVNLQTYLGSI
jgi:PAS domain S-box-containing protein